MGHGKITMRHVNGWKGHLNKICTQLSQNNFEETILNLLIWQLNPQVSENLSIREGN